jgi:hypothetical protein
MKTPVALVTIGLTLAILLAASLLIATGTRGEGAFTRHGVVTRDRVSPAASPMTGSGG